MTRIGTSGVDRRKGLRTAAAIALAAVVIGGTSSAAVAKTKPRSPGLLFALVAQSATIQSGTLTLGGVNQFHGAVYFSDRPSRQTGVIPIPELVAAVAQIKPAPNAALIGQAPDAAGETVVAIEISDPVFDPAANELRFAARQLERATGDLRHYNRRVADALPPSLADAALFIDPADPCAPVAVHNNTTVVPLTLSNADPAVRPSDGQGGYYQTYYGTPTALIAAGSSGSFWPTGLEGCASTLTYTLTGSQATLVATTSGQSEDGTFTVKCKIEPAGEPFDCSTRDQKVVDVNGP